MDTTERINRLNLNDASQKADADYIDENIALYKSIKDIPVDNGTIRLDMYVVLACVHGRMRLDINHTPYEVGENDVVCCMPSHTVNNCMLSPDFEGVALCVSYHALQELAAGISIWEHALQVMQRPLIHVSADSVRNLLEYSHALNTAIRSSQKLFRRQIIMSLVRACLCELASSIDLTDTAGGTLLTQKDHHFRSFIELLTGLDCKPRSVRWYADRLYVTPKYLSTACKDTSGRTAFQWINEYVGRDITYWLQNSNHSIKEIASRLQFPNNSFFGKYCRRHFGMSPTRLREHLRGNSKK